jgi:Peptidase A4 family
VTKAAGRWVAAAVGAGLALVLAGAVAPPASSAVGARPHAVTQSSNWSGYAAARGTYTRVTASWVQPAVVCTGATTYHANWVGLDGFDNAPLEQVGTSSDCLGGRARYGAWWEVLPATETPYSGVTVKPHDHLTASVRYEGAGRFTMSLTNSTEGWTRSTTHAGSPGFRNASAEVVSETDGATSAARANPGNVTYTNCRVNGTPLADFDPVGTVTPTATLSPFLTPTTFTVTRVPAGTA